MTDNLPRRCRRCRTGSLKYATLGGSMVVYRETAEGREYQVQCDACGCYAITLGRKAVKKKTPKKRDPDPRKLVGKVVAWSSQAGGSVKEKRGKVIGYIRPYEDITEHSAIRATWSRLDFRWKRRRWDAHVSQNGRLLVEVDGYLYAPRWAPKLHDKFRVVRSRTVAKP